MSESNNTTKIFWMHTNLRTLHCQNVTI